MPVPKPVNLIIPNYLPHKERNKRRIKEEPVKKREVLVIKHATVETLENKEEKSNEYFIVNNKGVGKRLSSMQKSM